MRERNIQPPFFAFIKLVFFSLFTALLIGWLSLAWGKEKTDPLETITKAELQDHIYYLASDFLGGRLPGSEGYRQASFYIASQLQAAGIPPFFKDAEGQESYFQPIDFMVSTVAPESTLRFKKRPKEITFASGGQFIPLLHGQAFKDGRFEGEAAFVGYGIEEPGEGWNDYQKIDISGKIALMVTGAPTKNGKPVLSKEKNELYGNLMESAGTRIKSALNHGAAAVIMILDASTAKMWSQVAPLGERPTRRLKADENKERTHYFSVFLLHPEAAVELLKETGFNPISGRGQVEPTQLKDTRVIFDLKYTIERDFVCRNVVGFIPGGDPGLKDEYVVVGAHLDHLGVRDEKTFNGADDNASGCAAILEAAEALALSPRRRSLFFVFYTGEEGGGHGSFHFVDNFPFSLEKVALAINVDVVGSNCEPFPDSLLGISPDKLKLELAQFMETTNKNTANVDLKTYLEEGVPGDYFGGSDEMMFSTRGIPTVLVTSGYNYPDYHKESDDPDKIDYNKVMAASRLIFALAVAAVDTEKPF
jgi:hypothetical protein